MGCLVIIPKRDSTCLHVMGGHKPPSSAAEVSIPYRDSRADKALPLLPSYTYDTG
jgi:hypothetical protein